MTLGILLGAAIAVLHGLAGIIIYRLAVRLPTMRSMRVAIGGIVMRLFLALIAVVLVLEFAAVNVSAFIGALFTVFAFMLAADVLLMHRLA